MDSRHSRDRSAESYREFMHMGHTDIEMSTWSSLTWDELEAWAGSRSVGRGRAYQQQHRVDKLVLGDGCQLLATVVGTRPYIVTVRMAEHSQGGIRLRSLCTCPVGDDGCKHAVATVLALLETLANLDQAPTAAPDDPRWDILREFASEDEDDEDDFGFDEFEDAPDMDEDRAWSRPASRGRNRSSLDPQIREYLNSQSNEELVELASSWAQRFAELHAELRDRIALREGNAERLVTQVRRELDDATAIRPWSNSWTGEGETPDYGRLTQRLERLIVAGYADEVVL